MGLWIASPEIASGDRVERRIGAAREISPLRSIGGYLFLTHEQLIHQPNRLGTALGVQPARWSWKSIDAFAVLPRELVPPILGLMTRLRRRLLVQLADGREEVFVVNHVDAVSRLLGACLSRSGTNT